MKNRILSAVLALCLFLSAIPNAYAAQEASWVPEDIPLESVSVPETYSVADGLFTSQEIYDAMTALQTTYPEGMEWTDYTPYNDGNYYHWKGGQLDGKNIVAVGCVAFAFLLSDAAFGTLPARMYNPGQFDLSDLKVGDILRMNTDTHTVIILEVSDNGVVIAEGNNSGKVHWERAIPNDVLQRDVSHYITRYPEGWVDPGDSSADEIVASGKAGTLDWELTKAGVLTISGSGAIPNYDNSKQPWYEHAGNIRKIVIKNGVTAIGNCAFMNVKALSVTIPNSVTSIGDSAFQNSSLISVSIPSSVKTINDYAFFGCTNLDGVTIANGVTSIGMCAFQKCTSLRSIEFPASVTRVGSSAFTSCTSLISAEFAPSSTAVTLGDSLFTQCSWLMYVTLPQRITDNTIPEGLFQSCTMLSSLIIPQGVTDIDTNVFTSSGLTYLAIPKSLTYIFPRAFIQVPLKHVYYEGTEAEWNSIYGLAQNPALTSAEKTFQFDYSGGSVPGGKPSWKIVSWNQNQVVFQDAPEEDVFLLAVRYREGRMTQVVEGSLSENTAAFQGLTLEAGDVIFILEPESLSPLTAKTMLE